MCDRPGRDVVASAQDDGSEKPKPTKKPKSSAKPAAEKKNNTNDTQAGEETLKGRTFAGRNPPTSYPALFRFEAALDAWNECLVCAICTILSAELAGSYAVCITILHAYLRHLDDLLPRNNQRFFMSFLAENGIYELHEETPIYQRAHEMAVLYALSRGLLEPELSQIRT